MTFLRKSSLISDKSYLSSITNACFRHPRYKRGRVGIPAIRLFRVILDWHNHQMQNIQLSQLTPAALFNSYNEIYEFFIT